ncbi:DUF3017 domain-containing protein [Dietzia cinnamea]|uniref:DUF3017 domain-containing protein n=1 Tax=Dietzia cinnamea TaxID=321318 RepID=UPI0005BDDDE3|nr:DUF3017 domain-containing protein [Dietzia cinnamea]MBC7306187.1 DUF3017 domain-containing protein [Dietzia sp.]MCT2275069.1 DUF3017 domain-containing protein [Dietzia cinnamea]
MTHPAPDRARHRATDARPRRTRPARLTWAQVRAQWPLALVLAGVVVALGFVVLERWRRGAFLLGLVALAAATLRAVLPDERARLLGVRGKKFDVAFYVGIGAVILWLATSVDSLGTG